MDSVMAEGGLLNYGDLPPSLVSSSHGSFKEPEDGSVDRDRVNLCAVEWY
jgi:hypothetical protein